MSYCLLSKNLIKKSGINVNIDCKAITNDSENNIFNSFKFEEVFYLVVINLGISISNGTEESSAKFTEVTTESFDGRVLQPVVGKDFMDTKGIHKPVNVVISQGS